MGPFWKSAGQQCRALLWKHALVAKRNYRGTFLRLLSPCFFLLLALLVAYAVRSSQNEGEGFREVKSSGRRQITPIRRCHEDIYIDPPCFDFIYSPDNNPVVSEIVTNMLQNNVPRMDKSQVKGFASYEAANSWLLANPEKTPAGVHFVLSGPDQVDFNLQLNTTVKFFRNKNQDPLELHGMPLQVAVHREIIRTCFSVESIQRPRKPNRAELGFWKWIRYHAKSQQQELKGFDLGWKLFPHPVQIGEEVMGTILGIFLFAAALFGFVSTLSGVVGERETKIVQSLHTMGMYRSAYWLSWIIWESIFALLVTLLTIAFGAAVQIDFFKKNSFGNTFFVLWLFQLAMVGFAFFLSSLIRKSSAATILGFFVFIVGFICQLVVAFGVPYTDDYYKKWGYILPIIFSLLPWCPFAKAIGDLGRASSSGNDGMSWSERDDCVLIGEDASCRMRLPLVMGIFVIEYFGYTILAVYLTAALPDDSGVRDSPWFFLLPSFWMPKRYDHTMIHSGMLDAPHPRNVDQDVAAEAQVMKEAFAQSNGHIVERPGSAVDIFGLQRRFKGQFWAITGSWFTIPQNQLFCLLGPNGAGKSTTINILTGVLPPTGGDAIIAGKSIRSPGGLTEIRAHMGVCPQFDVLWNELTGLEHMKIFGHIKGLPAAAVDKEARQLLQQVSLTSAQDLRSEAYSGGMKRRLSVAMALIGDPKLIFLDEPTTGMDPVSRRQVWDIIERSKQNRAIVLTTHSMEEADILGDRVAIMAHGSVRCIGSSLRLKQKFGAGYQVSISVLSPQSDGGEAARAENVKGLIRREFHFEPMQETKAYITYLISRDDAQRLPPMLKLLESNQVNLGITDIQIAMTTLEEVFLNISKQAEIEAAEGTGRTVQCEVEPGQMMEVPVGSDFIQNPSIGVVYKLHWSQNDRGTLMVDRVERTVLGSQNASLQAQAAGAAT